MTAELIAFYTDNDEVQWARFDTFARIEESVLQRALRAHLPRPPAEVADIGGGNGRHAFTLADWGYHVSLCDTTPALVAAAARRNREQGAILRSAEVADARALPWPDQSFDAALVLGPMYCLTSRTDRAAVLAELARTLRPGGVIFLQFFLRVAALRSLLEMAPAQTALFDWRTFLRTGRLEDPHLPAMMRVHYFTTVDEALREVREAGLEIRVFRGMDGPSPGFGQGRLSNAPAQVIEQWADICYEICGHPENVSTSTHLLAVASAP
jgi:ubiquinone/menaquinone biosynthesis C-methylase UbiE